MTEQTERRLLAFGESGAKGELRHKYWVVRRIGVVKKTETGLSCEALASCLIAVQGTKQCPCVCSRLGFQASSEIAVNAANDVSDGRSFLPKHPALPEAHYPEFARWPVPKH